MTIPDLAQATARFEAALDVLIDQVRKDRHILAGILCGSMSHDVVWDKSDIDLILICSDDRKTKSHNIGIERLSRMTRSSPLGFGNTILTPKRGHSTATSTK